MRLDFTFDKTDCAVFIQDEVPSFAGILREAAPGGGGAAAGFPAGKALIVCDTNTKMYAQTIAEGGAALCTLPAGEEAKTWASVEAALRAAAAAGLGRDGLFIGVGGGVVTDLCAFAASVYMRGARLALVSTTLLGMADAALGGKTGIDLFGVKNFAGTFYPAQSVWMPLSALATLSAAQRKSGLAEVIKALILDETLDEKAAFAKIAGSANPPCLEHLVAAVRLKGRIVAADPYETAPPEAAADGMERAKLNLGHTFAHALEAAAGFGSLTHGEAVAWGIDRACELGMALGITPPERARAISGLLRALGYATGAPHPAQSGGQAAADTAAAAAGGFSAQQFMDALTLDKKKKNGVLRFVIPAARGAVILPLAREELPLAQKIACGG